MKLKLEKDVKVAVEINNQPFITGEEGVLYQNLDDNDNEILLYIKTNNQSPKEIKIKITKYVDNQS